MELRTEPFDGAFSDFGGLNCVRDLERAAAGIAAHLRPGGVLIVSVMNRICLIETLACLRRGDWTGAFRRWRTDATARVGGLEIRLSYPTPGGLARAFAAHFTVLATYGLGIVTPPPSLPGFAWRHPAALRALMRLEECLRAWQPFRVLGDHFVMELERRAPAGTKV